ncbi:ThuA domain-containing protein [Leeia sp. TBRC 13508]|uniref:ThuA domain-containing protein n=1 Tax=Leeia speluncae TaxID=2884804 RepID=A0ABS8D890_9NEIS|nr:ThuA domain-containing protein [Leeia speluncae]MCB6184430.1 ThuA domain-containing protein [Leeia speluncae]
MKKVLMLSGGWPGHYPEAIADFAEEHLLQGFEVTRSTNLSDLLTLNLREFDLIIPNWTQGKLEKAEEAALVSAVEQGVGLVGWHGTADALNDNHMFHYVLGGQFICHPGDFVPYEVTFTNPDEEITQGLNTFKVYSEQYYMHVDPANEVIATTKFTGNVFPWIDGVEMPQAWKRRWGKGKVFYQAIGHTVTEFSIPEVMEMTRRGIQWAVRD